MSSDLSDSLRNQEQVVHEILTLRNVIVALFTALIIATLNANSAEIMGQTEPRVEQSF